MKRERNHEYLAPFIWYEWGDKLVRFFIIRGLAFLLVLIAPFHDTFEHVGHLRPLWNIEFT